MERDYLTKRELQEYLRISRGSVDKLMKDHDLPFFKLGKKVLFSKVDIIAFLEKKKIPAIPKKQKK
jgi:excisionase family DNA binding protein